MYIDERLLKILETHRGETVDVNFMISLIKTIAKEHETEQLRIGGVIERLNSIPKYNVTAVRDYSDCWLEEDLIYDESEDANYIKNEDLNKVIDDIRNAL